MCLKNQLSGGRMDTLLELSAAFKKIIVGYKNIKLLQDNTIENETESLDVCIKNTLKVNASKESHLNLFHQITLVLDGLNQIQMTKVELDFLEQDLIAILKTLYDLNHDGCSHKVLFSTIPYSLTTTLASWGYSRGLSSLGILIKDFILIPLSASNVTSDVAKNNIEVKVKSLFLDMLIKEQAQINVSEMSKLRDQIEQQKSVIQHQKDKIQDLEHQPEIIEDNTRSIFSQKFNTVTGGVASLFSGALASTDSQNIKQSNYPSNHVDSALLAKSMDKSIFTSGSTSDLSPADNILKSLSSSANRL